jgi:GxxExxY protein
MSVATLNTRLVDSALTGSIIGAFYDVFNELGFGFLEAVYVAALEWELRSRGHSVGREVAVRVNYKGTDIAWQRIDILVANRVVVETKAGEHMVPTAQLQLHNYLKATGLEVGLLLHFGPKPRFWRVYSPNRSPNAHPTDRSDQSDPSING